MKDLCKFFSLAAALSLISAPAFATAMVLDTADNWAGWHVDGVLGGTWGSFFDGPSGTGGNVSGGAQGGYNWQFDHLVVGGEMDVEGMHVPAQSPTTQFNQDWAMSFRGRAGYAFDRWLPYFTAGLGLTHATWSVTGGGSSSDLRPGATVGGGLDATISGNWFARGEYLYTNVPNRTVKVGAATLAGGSDDGTVHAGIGYKF